MDRAIKEYRLRRQERVDNRRGYAVSHYDSVEAFKRRRSERLEERMDANPRVAYGIAKGMGIDTSGMSPKEVYEAIEKGGGNARGKRPHGNAEYEFAKSEKKQSFKDSFKTPNGARFPKIKSGAKWDGSVLNEVARIAKKGGNSKKYDRVMQNIGSDDVVYQKGADGVTVASLPGLSQKFDNKMSGRSVECNKIYQEKIKKGEAIKNDMIEATNSMGIRLMGLENCFKGGSSTAEKIERKRLKDRAKAKEKLADGEINEEEAKRMSSKTDEDYTRSFGDVVRFTALSGHDDTVKTVNDTIKALEKKGYECTELDNKWLPDKDGKPSEYKAVHLTFKSPTGESFEVQVHSNESMKIKNLNHALYEEQRKPGVSPGHAAELGKKMADNAAKLKEPNGIMKLKSFKKD